MIEGENMEDKSIKNLNDESTTDMIDLDPKSKIKSKIGKNYTKKFDNLNVKYEKDKKKYVIAFMGLLLLVASLLGSSYAYLTYVSSTENSTIISAGSIAIDLSEPDNSLTITNALPVKDETGLSNAKEYKFTIKNTGNVGTNYKILIANHCTVGETYKINNKDIKADKCLLDEYVKIGIKDEYNDYIIKSKTDPDKYIILEGSLLPNETKNYTMKMWLAENTPNIFNGKDGDVVYLGKLEIEYEQSA